MRVQHSITIDAENILQPVLHRRVYEGKQNKELTYSIRHTKHSFQRAAQRAILNETILDVLDFGEAFHRQGLVFYTIKEKNIPAGVKHINKKKTQNIVDVMNGNETEIITCYKLKNAIKLLRRKGKAFIKSN